MYTSRTLSLAALEYLVHLDAARAPSDLVALTHEFPDELVTTLDVAKLPKKWRELPAHPACEKLGEEWREGMTSVRLAVPSAVVPTEWNVILNPRHARFGEVQVVGEEGFGFDVRLP